MKILFLGSLFFGSSFLKAQDAVFYQPFASPVELNPAYAGAVKCSYAYAERIVLPFQINQERNQNTLGLSWDRHVFPLGGGVALGAVSNAAGNGLIQTRSVHATYSYLLPIWKYDHIRLGLQPGWEWRTLDPSKGRFESNEIKQMYQLPDSLGIQKLNRNYFVLNAGISISNFNFWEATTSRQYSIGFAVKNINRPHWQFEGQKEIRKNFQFSAQGELMLWRQIEKYSIGDRIFFRTIFISQNKINHLFTGFYGVNHKMIWGLYYHRNKTESRIAHAIQPNLGYSFNDKINVNYGADIRLPNRVYGLSAVHTITLSIQYCVPPGMKPYRPLITPEF